MFAVAAFLVYRALFTAGPPTPEPLLVMFMCSETSKTFEHAMQPGEHWPVNSPFTTKKTGYPVERCFWTRDGKRKLTPTYVILNENLGKKGDTICPDCGRIVIGHNPPPPPDVPLAGAPAPAPKPADAQTTAKPSQSPSTAAPSGAAPATATPSNAAKLSSEAAAKEQTKAQAEGMMFATIRAKMEEMISQRAAMLKEGRPSTDPAVRQLEDAILRAQQMLKQHGEHVPEVTPPITPPAASAPA
jgi:hypothetical protein